MAVTRVSVVLAVATRLGDKNISCIAVERAFFLGKDQKIKFHILFLKTLRDAPADAGCRDQTAIGIHVVLSVPSSRTTCSRRSRKMERRWTASCTMGKRIGSFLRALG